MLASRWWSLCLQAVVWPRVQDAELHRTLTTALSSLPKADGGWVSLPGCASASQFLARMGLIDVAFPTPSLMPAVRLLLIFHFQTFLVCVIG